MCERLNGQMSLETYTSGIRRTSGGGFEKQVESSDSLGARRLSNRNGSLNPLNLCRPFSILLARSILLRLSLDESLRSRSHWSAPEHLQRLDEHVKRRSWAGSRVKTINCMSRQWHLKNQLQRCTNRLQGKEIGRPLSLAFTVLFPTLLSNTSLEIRQTRECTSQDTSEVKGWVLWITRWGHHWKQSSARGRRCSQDDGNSNSP